MSDHSALPAPTQARYTRAALLLGFLALWYGVLLAHRTPETAYELSVYSATPNRFWAAVGLALFVSLVVSLAATRRPVRLLAVFLGGASMLAITGLPIIRGYNFYGAGDSLTHLGFAIDLRSGALSPLDLFYPGLHSFSLLLSDLTGNSIEQSLLLAVVLFVVVFFLFVPLCVRTICSHTLAVPLGAASAFLLLPINHIAIKYISPHPISEAVLFSPVIIYLLLKYVGLGSAERRDGQHTGGHFRQSSALLFGGALVVVNVGTVLYHSEQAANLLVVFVTVATLQFLYRRVSDRHPISNHRAVYGQTLVFLFAFGVWNAQHEAAQSAGSAVIRELNGLFGGSSQAGAVVNQQEGSLASLGTGLPELFLKLFLVSALYAVPAGLLVLGSLWDSSDESTAKAKYLAVAIITVSVYSAMFFVGNVSELFFRNLGFVMVLVTILGGVALTRLFGARAWYSRPIAGRNGLLVVVLALLFVSSHMVLYPSPYIYQPNEQLSEQSLSGYDSAFEYQDPEIRFLGIRSGPQRYLQGLEGRSNVPVDTRLYYRSEGRVPGRNLDNLSASVNESRYLIVTRTDRVREIVAYDQLRYSRSQFAAIRSQRNVSRVVSNGGFDMYLVQNSTTQPPPSRAVSR